MRRMLGFRMKVLIPWELSIENSIMLRRLAVLAVLVTALSCSDMYPVVYGLAPRPTAEYPNGAMDEPISDWVAIGKFPSMITCEASLDRMQSRVQRPVQCIPSDDPRLRTGLFGTYRRPVAGI